MKTNIPTAEQIRDKLSDLNLAQTQALADASDVPFTTLLKIRNGTTENPRIETVRQFYHLIDAASKTPA